MSWLFSQALVEAFSEANSLDGAPFAPSSGTPMPPAFLWRVKTTAAWSRFPSGMTCKPLTDDHGEALLKWFLAASHAPTYPSPDEVPVSTARRPACGSTWPESLAKFDPNTSSWRTAQRLLFEDSTESLETFPRWGLMRGGELWALSTPERLTEENGSGLWPTPRTTGLDGGSNSRKAAKARGMWPTPTADDANNVTRISGQFQSLTRKVQMFPTPTCQDASNNGGKSQKLRNTKPLNAEVGGALNPMWVEWLMGWPLGLTDLSAAVTDKFRQWCASHGIS